MDLSEAYLILLILSMCGLAILFAIISVITCYNVLRNNNDDHYHNFMSHVNKSEERRDHIVRAWRDKR